MIDQNFKWSFSKLSTYNTCPFSFWLQYMQDPPLEKQQNAWAEFGNLCHELLEQYGKGELTLDQLPVEYEKRYAGTVVHNFPPTPKDYAEKAYQQGLEYFKNFKGFGDRYENQKVPVLSKDVEQAIMDWYDGKFFVYDNQEIFEANQSESIIQVFTMAVRKYGCKLFLVDNLMTALSDSEEETKAQGRFVNALKRFANRFKVHVIVVAHPRKTKSGESIRQDDIGGNSATVRLAHSAIVVEKPNLRVIKARDSGHLKLIECCYCPDSRRIYQKDTGDMNRFGWNVDNLPMPKIKACDSPEYQVQVGQPEQMF